MSKADILRLLDYLGHILQAIERIDRYVEDLDEVGFLQDEKTQQMQSSATLKSSAKPPTTSNAIIPNLPNNILKCR
jgi:hypothetical protein